jgi:hypothetical protein
MSVDARNKMQIYGHCLTRREVHTVFLTFTEEIQQYEKFHNFTYMNDFQYLLDTVWWSIREGSTNKISYSLCGKIFVGVETFLIFCIAWYSASCSDSDALCVLR